MKKDLDTELRVKAATGKLLLLPMKADVNSRELIRQIHQTLRPSLNRCGRCAETLVCYAIHRSAFEGDDASFSDLKNLCRVIFAGAAFSAHYDGLLVLDLRTFEDPEGENELKLAALGEGLSVWMRYGYTVVLAPEKAEWTCEIMDAFEQSAPVDSLAMKEEAQTAETLIAAETGMTKDLSAELMSLMAGMTEKQGRLALQELRDAEGRITKSRLKAALANPYSHLSRYQLRRKHAPGRAHSRIGFGDDLAAG